LPPAIPFWLGAFFSGAAFCCYDFEQLLSAKKLHCAFDCYVPIGKGRYRVMSALPADLASASSAILKTATQGLLDFAQAMTVTPGYLPET